jgi:hypothetical protein
VTTPSIMLIGKNDLGKITSVIERIIKSLEGKLKDYRKNSDKVCSKMGFIIALSCAKMLNSFLIPTQYKPLICNKVKEYIESHPEISAVILSWCWYDYFPEITEKHLGAVFTKDYNGIMLIRNELANVVLPEYLSFGAQVII